MAHKSVLITGCSAGGIGFALALAFQKRGLHVFATARTLSKMADLEKLPNITLLSLDVTSSSSIAAAVNAVQAKTGGTLDYLVNNSGGGFIMPVLDTDIDEARRMFEVNIFGVLAVTQAFAPLVIAAKGTVVNNSSIAGCLHSPFMGVYAASKAALTYISESLRLEMAPLGVKVVTTMTGGVTTNFFANAPEYHLPPTSRYMPVEKTIAQLAKGINPGTQVTAETYAQKVVGDVLGGASGKIWRGGMATTVWWVMMLMPTWLLDRMQMRRNELDTFGETGRAGKA